MEPVELTLARYRTADLLRDAHASRVAAGARLARPASARRSLAAVTAAVTAAVVAASTRLEHAVHAPLVAPAHRLAPRPTTGGQVCCA